jgi:hypothetical protein
VIQQRLYRLKEKGQSTYTVPLNMYRILCIQMKLSVERENRTTPIPYISGMHARTRTHTVRDKTRSQQAVSHQHKSHNPSPLSRYKQLLSNRCFPFHLSPRHSKMHRISQNKSGVPTCCCCILITVNSAAQPPSSLHGPPSCHTSTTFTMSLMSGLSLT